MAAPKGNCFNPEGRPRKEIDWEQFQLLCELHCTQAEMAGIFRLHDDQFKIRVEEHYKEDYSEVYKRYSSNGKCSLRRKQVALSETNAAMAIWLGKQLLGQKENHQDNIVSEDTIKQFAAIMSQINDLQCNRKIDNNNNNNECKS
jgi:rhamnose utilization protein RhaD (predicted bifunctional aldolase and dehydrogenase)